MPLAEPPSRDSRFGTPLELSHVREDKPAREVVRSVP
jgi:hypothetical protein